MEIYRINECGGKTIGCIAARSSEVAEAYALGKYGAGCDVSQVDTKSALDAVGVCVLVETKEIEIQGAAYIQRRALCGIV